MSTQSTPAIPMVSLGLDILKVYSKNEEVNNSTGVKQLLPVTATRNSCMTEKKNLKQSPKFTIYNQNPLKVLDDRDHLSKLTFHQTALTPFEKSQKNYVHN